MLNKKLDPNDLEELRKRGELINQHLLIVEALKLQTQIYIKNLLPKYGVDMNKDYEIDLKYGIIKQKQTPKET